MSDSKGFAIINARIVKDYTDSSLYEGMAIYEGRVIYVGNNEGAKRAAREHGLEVVDKRGLFVIPGFIDAHMHLESLGLTLETLDMREVSSIEELIAALREKYDRDRPSVLVGRGWDHERFAEKRMPTARDLDRASRDIPIVISRVCGHAVSVNTIALEMMRERLKSLDERLVPRDSQGEPIGILFEDAGYIAWELASSFFDKKKILLTAMRKLTSLGVTSVGWMSVKPEQLKALRELYEERENYMLRTHVYVDPSAIDEARLNIDYWNREGGLSINGVKLFADGSLGARTAYLSEDYNDMPGHRGILLIDENETYEEISDIVNEGLQPAVHAIGDEAARTVLRIYKRAKAWRTDGRIEHVSLAPPDVIMAMRENRAIAVVQPRFVVSDWWAGERLGPRARHLYPFKTMYQEGVTMALSTDTPVEPPDPWLTVQAAETNGAESLARQISLYLYTVGSARALRRYDLGRLSEGYRADFLVTDFNPLTISRGRLSEAYVLETYVNGEKVYPFDGPASFF